MKYRELSELAIHSAIGIDMHLIGKAKEENYEFVKELSDKIDYFSKEKLNPTRLTLFAEVMWPNRDDLKGKKVDSVYLQMNLLSKELLRFKELKKERQKFLRSICIEFGGKFSRYSEPFKHSLAA